MNLIWGIKPLFQEYLNITNVFICIIFLLKFQPGRNFPIPYQGEYREFQLFLPAACKMASAAFFAPPELRKLSANFPALFLYVLSAITCSTAL